MQILVDAKWLRACGMERWINKPMPVIRTRNFGRRGILFTVQLDYGFQWQVFDWRGVKVIDDFTRD